MLSAVGVSKVLAAWDIAIERTWEIPGNEAVHVLLSGNESGLIILSSDAFILLSWK